MEISKEAIEEVIKYIDHRFEDDKHQNSNWSMPDGSKVSADVGYAYEWWEDCMKKELEALARKNTSKKIKKVVDATKLERKMRNNSSTIIRTFSGEELKTQKELWNDLIKCIRESTVDIEIYQ